jgi:hypothetical protein
MLPVIERPAQAGTQPESGAGAAPKRKSIQRWFGGPAPSATLQGALAAALVLAAALSLWLAFDRIRLKERLGGAATELSNRRQAQAEIESRLAAEQAARGRLESEIARLRQEILGRATRPGSGGQGRVVSLVLSAVLVRGAGTSQEINLTPAAEWVRLELKVGEDETGSFRAEVRTVEGSRIWSRGSIRPDRSAVILEIPASNLAAGDYILILSAERAGRTEEVNRYFFRIYRAERSPNQ